MGPDAGELFPIISRNQEAITNKRNNQQHFKYKKTASAYYSQILCFHTIVNVFSHKPGLQKTGNISWRRSSCLCKAYTVVVS